MPRLYIVMRILHCQNSYLPSLHEKQQHFNLCKNNRNEGRLTVVNVKMTAVSVWMMVCVVWRSWWDMVSTNTPLCKAL